MEEKKINNTTLIKNEKIYKMAQNGLIIAVMLIMAFTPLGYIKTAGIEITLMPIPVVVGAIILGPASGMLFGAVFGITSFLQCIGIPTLSWFGSTLLQINGLYTVLMCMVPRMLMGFLAGLIFKGLSKIDKTKFVSYVVTCISGALMNTIFFITFLMVMFGKSEFIIGLRGSTNLLTFLIGFVSINGLIEMIVCAFTGVAISKVLSVIVSKRNKNSRLS